MVRRVTLSADALNYSKYGDNSRFMSSYLDSQLREMGGRSRGKDDYVYQALEEGMRYVDDRIRTHRLQDELARQGMRGRNDNFRAINTFDGLRYASLEMQRWIMAEPSVRKMYLEENLDGYSDTYENFTGNGIGEDDYNYRRATDGMVMFDENGDGYVKHYFEDLIPGDRDLTFREKSQILSTWSTIRRQFKESVLDFTNNSDEYTNMNR